MEGRTIVRPGSGELVGAILGYAVLQWRAGQLSGQAGLLGLVLLGLLRLQWRAGQLSGQAKIS